MLVAVVIVGVIAALVLPSIVSHYQEKSFDRAFQRETQTIQSAVEGLAVNENKASFFETMMYTTEEPTTYTDSAEKFIKTYLRPSKLCGDNNGDCFATRYYKHENNDKKVYTPTYKGSCAKLKNGASICLTAQTGAQAIEGIIDINGEKSPNVLNKDLRLFTLNVQTQAGRSTEIAAVLDLPFTPIKIDDNKTEETVDPCEGMTCGCGSLPDCDPCAGKTCGCGSLPACPTKCSYDQSTWDVTCCEKNPGAIGSPTHPCCRYSVLKSKDFCKYSCNIIFSGNKNSGIARISGSGAAYCHIVAVKRGGFSAGWTPCFNNTTCFYSNIGQLCAAVSTGTGYGYDYNPCYKVDTNINSYNFTFERIFQEPGS